MKEYEITKNFDHANIVHSIELFDNTLKEEVHQVMEYVQGLEVLDSIAQQPHGCYTESDAKGIFKQILQGIQYLHAQGVAHRDIKPQNLLVTQTQKVVIIDFNISSKKPEGQSDFRMMTKTGTVAFSAPEIFTQKVYDEKVDIWSAATVLYIMLSGN